MSGLPKVLVVEDQKILLQHVVAKLRGRAIVLGAATIEDARKLFAEHPDVRVITVDGSLSRRSRAMREPETARLVQEFRRAFTGPMIAASSDPVHCRKLVEAGCDHEIENKLMLPREIERLLGDIQEGRAK